MTNVYRIKLIRWNSKDKDFDKEEYREYCLNNSVLACGWPADEECPLTDLSQYGVPSNGLFHIDALSKKRMQLSTDDAKLTFRKY